MDNSSNANDRSLHYWFGFLSQLLYHEHGREIIFELYELCHGKSPRGAKFREFYIKHNIIVQFAMFPYLNEAFEEAFLTLVCIENGCINMRIPDVV
jgi:hypothetical protein